MTQHKSRSTNSVDDIIQMLKKYTDRVQSNTVMIDEKGHVDYGPNFLFFKNSRSINREVNYLTAFLLLRELEKTKDLNLLNTVQKIKSHVIEKFGFRHDPNFVERDMSSSELNKIIETAQSLKK